MRAITVQLCLAFLFYSFCAEAAENMCNNIPELQPFDLDGCECGKSISKLPITAPKGMSLIAACNYKKVEFVGSTGRFYFKGKATLSGNVRRKNGSDFRDSILFDANKTVAENSFRSAVNTMRVVGDLNTINKFKSPPLSEESPCWASVANITVKLLYVISGYESDEEGSYPKDLDVLKVGQYSPCQAEKSN